MALFSKKEAPSGLIKEESKIGAETRSKIGSEEEKKAAEPAVVKESQEIEPFDVFKGKTHLEKESLVHRAGKAPFKIPDTHKLLQQKARKGIVEKYFADQKYVDTKEFSRKINELEKKVPWIKSPNEQEQTRKELNFLKQLRKAA